MKCSWRNCKEKGTYLHEIKRDNEEDCQHKGYLKNINRVFCVYHHRIAKRNEIIRGQRESDM